MMLCMRNYITHIYLQGSHPDYFLSTRLNLKIRKKQILLAHSYFHLQPEAPLVNLSTSGYFHFCGDNPRLDRSIIFLVNYLNSD